LLIAGVLIESRAESLFKLSTTRRLLKQEEKSPRSLARSQQTGISEPNWAAFIHAVEWYCWLERRQSFSPLICSRIPPVKRESAGQARIRRLAEFGRPPQEKPV